MPALDLEKAKEEFNLLKAAETGRNKEYYLLRQAVKGNFRWPSDWPAHILKVKHNLCKPITERFTTYLMGKGFSWNMERPNTLEYREKAERTEKILKQLFKLSDSDLQFDVGARTGSQLGRTVYKVYKKGPKGAEHACFSYCQPDYFYGIPAADNALGDYAVVYYAYGVDHREAVRRFGPGNYKTADQIARGDYYDPLPESWEEDQIIRQKRKIPVMEAWTKDGYALVVGDVVKYNGDLPSWCKRKVDGEPFIPYVVIENIRNAGDGKGESDIAQSRELNEQYNYLLSGKNHITRRWLHPTLVWEGAPQNYADTLTATLGGGGAIPARLGSRLYFLAYDRPNPAVAELEQTIRAAILETAGMSEIALQGTVQGSINTGPALEAQFTPALSTVSKKQKEWEAGLQRLTSMLLEIQEDIGDSKVLGEAVVNETYRSDQGGGDGELVDLSGKDIDGLREVTISWPGVLPKDDAQNAKLEMDKAAQGLQSFYTTLEKLGEEYPADELSRISRENMDPSLKGEKVAENQRGDAAAMGAQAQAMQALTAAQQAGQAPPDGGGQPPLPDGFDQLPPDEQDLYQGDQSNLGAKLRELARNRAPQLNMEGDQPVVEAGAASGGY